MPLPSAFSRLVLPFTPVDTRGRSRSDNHHVRSIWHWSQSRYSRSGRGSRQSHRGGRPMSHATQSGFNVPTPSPLMSGWLPNIFCILPLGVPAASSFAVGVGHAFAVALSPAPCPVLGLIPLRSVAVGVGHKRVPSSTAT